MTHRLRATHDAILVGIGTVLADNPRLTVRLADGPDPQPVILDSRLRTPTDANLLSNPTPPWIFTVAPVDAAHRHALEQAGARIVVLPPGLDGKADPGAVLDHLGGMGIRRVMVEGGAEIIQTFLASGLVDQVAITVAPIFVGDLRAYGRSPEVAFPRLDTPSVAQLGQDTLIWGKIVP